MAPLSDHKGATIHDILALLAVLHSTSLVADVEVEGKCETYVAARDI